MPNFESFELIRQSDELVYCFDRKNFKEGAIGYHRRDKDLWITFREELGWVAFDDENNEIQGMPWGINFLKQNNDHPPEGIWVSRKGDKSYVYELKYK